MFTGVVYVTPLTDTMVYVFSDLCDGCSIIIHYNYAHVNSQCLNCLDEFSSYMAFKLASQFFATSMRRISQTFIEIKLRFSTVLNSYRISIYLSSHVSNYHTNPRFAVVGSVCALLLASHVIHEYYMCVMAFQNGTPVYAFKLRVGEPAAAYFS